MQFQSFDLGHRKRGEIVQVTLSGNAANVRLMDSSNFQRFKRNGSGKYYGGSVRRSPIKIPIPHSGHWFVAIDLGGLKGRVRSSVSVLPGSLPAYGEPSLSSVPSLLPESDRAPFSGLHRQVKKYDVFISHSSEDKDDVVRRLAHELRDLELNVWYDEFELRIGDSLREKIDYGLANSRFGIVVLSEHFFKKGWTNYELDGLVTIGISGDQQRILPIWHKITKSEVIAYSPSLADKVARNTTTHSIEDIAAEIAELILGDRVTEPIEPTEI